MVLKSALKVRSCEVIKLKLINGIVVSDLIKFFSCVRVLINGHIFPQKSFSQAISVVIICGKK